MLMNQKVFDAARTGNIAEIPDNLPGNQAVPVSEWTPFHIACSLAKKEFAETFLTKDPQYLTLVNPNGCNALHLACFNGHLEIVDLLLTFRSNNEPHNAEKIRELCIKRDKDGRTPLHHAVINGNVAIVRRLLEKCPESSLEATNKGETVFHLAVKNKKSPSKDLFETLLGGPYTGCILNLADGDGNTVLHLAAVRTQTEIISLLIEDEYQDILEVNAVNSSGLTALDLLVIDPMNNTDITLEQEIMSAGGVRLTDNREKRENFKAITSGLIIMASFMAAGSLQIAVYLHGVFWTTATDLEFKFSLNGNVNSSFSNTKDIDILKEGKILYCIFFMGFDGFVLLLSLCLIAVLLLPAKVNFEGGKWVVVRVLASLTVMMFTGLFLTLAEHMINGFNGLQVLLWPLQIFLVIVVVLTGFPATIFLARPIFEMLRSFVIFILGGNLLGRLFGGNGVPNQGNNVALNQGDAVIV